MKIRTFLALAIVSVFAFSLAACDSDTSTKSAHTHTTTHRHHHKHKQKAAVTTVESVPAEPAAQDYEGQYDGETCPEIGHSYTVTPGTDPAHDNDGDGISCETQ